MREVTALLAEKTSDRWLGIAIASGGVAAAVGSRLNWPARSLFGDGVPGSLLPQGTRVLWLGVACGLVGIALVVVRQHGARAALAAVAALGGTIAVWDTARVGFRAEPFLGLGIYVTAAGAATVVIAAATFLALSLGMPQPGFSVGVAIGLIALGTFGWVFNILAANQIRSAGASRLLITSIATLLLASGVGLLTRQTWAWVLALGLTAFGVVGNGLTALRVEELRAPSYLAAFMYFTALRALWNTRGPLVPISRESPDVSGSGTPEARGASALRSAGQDPPAPASVAPDAPFFSPGIYVQRCLHPAYFEEEETRSWRSDPSLKSALDPLNAGDHRRAAQEAEKITQRLPDLDLGYWWRGSALSRMGDQDSARVIVQTGLRHTKRKFLLLQQLGEIEWKARNLDEAVYAWSQAIHCQERLERYGEDVGAYLHMHYVAAGVGSPQVAAAMVARVDRISFGEIRLEPASAADLTELARTRSESVPAVLRGLYDRYLGNGHPGGDADGRPI